MNKFISVFLVFALVSFCGADFVFSQRSEAQTEEKGHQIIVDESLTQEGMDSIAAAWLGYAMKLILWRGKAFFETFPNETTYRYTFEEEADARETLVKVWIELKEKDPSLKDQYLDELALVYNAGYLKEYVFIFFNHPDWQVDQKTLRVDDFVTWSQTNLPDHKPKTLSGVSQ